MNCNSPISDTPIRVYFLGSGGIAVPTLGALRASPRLCVCGVGTQPDRPAGRKRLPIRTPVARSAETLGLAVDKPRTVNSPEFIRHVAGLAPEIAVVFSFGQILKEELLRLAPHGCMNVHASLLPRHRGASPVSAAILAGDAETGVCFMQMERGLDTGPIYERHAIPLRGTETTSALEDALAELAARHVVACVERICRDGIEPTPQAAEGVTYAGKLKKEDGLVNWGEPAVAIERSVRAFDPWPRAWLTVPGRKQPKRIQVTAAEVVADTGDDRSVPGQVLQADKKGFVIQCGEGALRLERIVPEGKGEMTAEEFLRGHRVEPGLVL